MHPEDTGERRRASDPFSHDGDVYRPTYDTIGTRERQHRWEHPSVAERALRRRLSVAVGVLVAVAVAILVTAVWVVFTAG